MHFPISHRSGNKADPQRRRKLNDHGIAIELAIAMMVLVIAVCTLLITLCYRSRVLTNWQNKEFEKQYEYGTTVSFTDVSEVSHP